MSVDAVGRGDPPTSANATPPLADDARLFESYLNSGNNAGRQHGAAPNAARYAFSNSPWSPETPTMTDIAPFARRLPWIAFGLSLAEALDRGAGPPPLKQADYALAPHLSLRIYGQGRIGPNGETAAFLQRNAQLGQGEDQVLPVRAEWTSSGLRFDQNELERAYGGKLPAEARRRLRLQGGPDDPPKKPDPEKPGLRVPQTVVPPPGGARPDGSTGARQPTWRVDTAGEPDAARVQAGQRPGGIRTILIDTPARIQATEPRSETIKGQQLLTWELLDAQSGAVFGDVHVPIQDPANPGAPILYLHPKVAELPNGSSG